MKNFEKMKERIKDAEFQEIKTNSIQKAMKAPGINDLRNGTAEEISERARLLGKRKKGKRHKLSRLKQKIGKEAMEAVLEVIEENVIEFIEHENDAVRFEATKAFIEYYKPKKKEVNVKASGNISFNVNSNILSNSDEME